MSLGSRVNVGVAGWHENYKKLKLTVGTGSGLWIRGWALHTNIDRGNGVGLDDRLQAMHQVSGCLVQ